MKARHGGMDKGCECRPEQPGGKPKCKHHMLNMAFANLAGVFLKNRLNPIMISFPPGTPFDLSIMSWATQDFLPFFSYF